MGGSKATVDHPAQARHAAGGAADYLSTMSPAGSPAETIDRVVTDTGDVFSYALAPTSVGAFQPLPGARVGTSAQDKWVLAVDSYSAR